MDPLTQFLVRTASALLVVLVFILCSLVQSGATVIKDVSMLLVVPLPKQPCAVMGCSFQERQWRLGSAPDVQCFTLSTYPCVA